MSDPKVNIDVEMSTENVDQSVANVNTNIKRMADNIQKDAKRAGVAVDGIGDTAAKLPEKFTRAESTISSRIKRATTSLEDMGKTASQKLEASITRQGLDASKFEPELKKLRELEIQAARSSMAVNRTMNAFGSSAKQTANAMRQIPMQMTDVVTQLAGGQNPMLILLQQGGQLKDSFGGIRPMLAGVGLAIGASLTNPVTMAAAAVVTLGAAYYTAAKELSEFNRSLIMTNSYSGQTVASMSQLADAMARGVVTHSDAVEALNAVAASGRFTSEQVRTVSAAIESLSFVSGEKIPKVASLFEKLAKDPAKASIELNEQYHYLNASVYEQIAALEAQGRKQEAVNVAIKAFADASGDMRQKMVADMNVIEMSWAGFGLVIDKVWKKIKDVADNSDLAKLKNIQSLITSLEKQNSLDSLISSDSIDQLKLQESTLRAKITFDKRTAEWNAGVKQDQEKSIAAQREINGLLEKGADKQTKYNKAISEYEKSRAAAAKTGQFYTPEQDRTIRTQIKRDIFGEEKKTPKSDPLENAYTQQSLQLSKEIAKSETTIANIRAGILESDGQHLAAMKEWLTYDKEGKKLSDAQKANLIERAVLADKLGMTAQLEKEHQKFMQSAYEREKKDLRDIAAIRETGSGARYTSSDDWLATDSAKKLQANDIAKFYQEYAAKLGEDQRSKDKTAAGYLYSLDQQEKSLSRQIQLLGMSTQEQEKQQALWQLEEEFLKSVEGMKEDDLDYQKMKTRYMEQQSAISAQLEAKRIFERDPTMQSVKALREYADEASNLGAQISDAWVSAFGGMEDALVEFATSGKLSFKDLADQIIADLIRIQIRSQITGPLAQMMGGGSANLGGMGDMSSWIGSLGKSGYEASSDSYFSSEGSGLLGWLGGLFGGARAEGGPVSSNSLYRVNERGPELLTVGGRDYLMMGSQSGSVTPNEKLGGGKSVNVRITQSFAAGTDKKTADQAGLAAARAINRAQRRNG